jgi:hypothetical protein
MRKGMEERVVKKWQTVAMLHIVQFSDLDERVPGKHRKKR